MPYRVYKDVYIHPVNHIDSIPMPPLRSPHCAQRCFRPITLRYRFSPERAVSPPPITLQCTFPCTNPMNHDPQKIKKPESLPGSLTALQHLLNLDKTVFLEIIMVCLNFPNLNQFSLIVFNLRRQLELLFRLNWMFMPLLESKIYHISIPLVLRLASFHFGLLKYIELY